MDNNCNDLINDVVKIYVLEPGACQYSIPPTVKVNSMSPSLMGVDDVPTFLSSRYFFSASDVSSDTVSEGSVKFVVIDEFPQMKITSSFSSKGLIFKLSATASIEAPTVESEKALERIMSIEGADYVFQLADGSYRLFRSLSSSSAMTSSEDSRKERKISVKIEAQSVSGVIPII